MKFLPKRSEADKQRIIAEAFDPNKIILVCKKHMYTGEKGIPTDGCVDCHTCYWTVWAAKLDPNKRTEIIEHMQELAHMAVELAEKGQWDVKLDEHPTIKIEKGVGD
jgi:hypothetical protein